MKSGRKEKFTRDGEWVVRFKVCLDGEFRREREKRVYFSFLNYEHDEMFFIIIQYLCILFIIIQF